MLKTAPNPVDVQDLQFKLRSRLKIFDNKEATSFSQPCNLIACASRYGLIFIGTNTPNFQVIQLKHLEEYTKSDGDKLDYPRRNVSLPSPPRYLSVNCEHTILAVIIEKNGCPCALFYDVKSFWQQNFNQIAEVRLSSTPGVSVIEVNWNPALAAIFTACKSDGTLGIYEIKNPGGIDINELPAAAAATCFCWSPKGKQIAVGSRDGKITQYKPDLKAVKVINPPPLKEPHSLISLQWVSNYQFIGVFQPVNPNNQSCLIVIDAPKTGDPTYMNYDDICYSNGNARPIQFYMILQQNWNILMVASSNSMEVGILGNSGECWTQWIMGDAARAELPLSSDRQETLPIGFGLDIGSTQPVQWGESTLPPCPFLLLLSHHGTLCCFNIVNLKQGIPSICTPPDPVADTSGLQQFVAKSETIKQNISVVQPTVQLKIPQPKPSAAPAVFEIKTSVPSNKPQTQGLNFSTTQASNLFGGQATLIPVTQGVTKSAPVVSQPLYPTLPYQSVYPSLPVGESKPVTATVPQQVSASFVPPKPPVSTVPQPTPNSPKLSQPKFSEELNKTDIISVDLKAEEEAEALFAQMVKEECIFLESELKAVLHQGRSLKINLGSDEEKTKIVQTTKTIQDFFKELADLCVTQNAEVHILKQNLLQSWAWYEEVKSRHVASRDESMMVLLRALPLDSASEKQLADIRHSNYYLESQIAQAHRALDEQWENFQDYCKKTHKMQIPTMEMIFQTMVKQNAILRKQGYILKDISNRIKSKSRSALGSSLLISVNDNADLPGELKRLRLNPEDICNIQYEHVVNRMKNFTKNKTETLRSFLKKREYTHVSAVKPHLSTSVIQASPSMKLKSFSNLLETKASPVLKENIQKKLEFVQSTPKPVTVKYETPSPQANTPIEGLQNFALKFETKNFAKPPEKSFVPLTKSGIASSPNSAFVSTTFGNVVSTASPFKPVIFATSVTANSAVKAPANLQTTIAASSPNPNALTKSFSFSSTTPMSTAFSQDAKPSIPTFVGASTSVSTMSKSTFSFSLPTTTKAVTTASLTSTVTTASIFASSKPSSVVSSLNLTTSNKAVTTSVEIVSVAPTKTTAPTSSIFGATVPSTNTTSSPFSLAGSIISTSSIFGATTEKTSEAVTVTPSKPFVFSSVATKTTAVATVTTTPNRFVTATTVSTPIQSSFITSLTSPDTNKVTAPVTTTPAKVVTQPPPATSIVPPSSVFTSTPTTTKSIFGNLSVTTTQTTSIFSSPVTTQSATAVTKPSIFGAAVSQPFGTAAVPATSSTPAATPLTTHSVTSLSTTVTSTPATASSVIGSTTPLNPVFGAATNSQQSVFGSSSSTVQPSTFAPVNTTTGFAFGSTATTKPLIFGGTDTSTTKTSIFGSTASSTSPAVGFGATPPATTQSLPFGANTANQTPIFGGSVPSTSSPASTSIFGNVPPSTTTQSQGFGVFTDTVQKSTIFGSAAASTNPTQSSIFGNSTQTSIFGSTTTTASPSFGQNQTTPQSVFGQSSGFGSSGSSFGTTSVFGAPPASSFGQTSGSLFGNPGATTSGSIFGGTPTTSSAFGGSGSVFGTPASSSSSIFGSGTVFSSAATQPSSFASSTNAGSFGFGGLNVGATPTTASSGFGATPTANPFGGETKNVFGSPAATGTSAFGTSSGSLFGNTSQTFGGGSSNFGNQSVFGQQSTFGQNSFGSSSFGQQSSGPFSGGSSSTVAQSGFGGAPAFQKSGFGSSPAFGSPPAFGSAPSFGGAPAFGSSSTFAGSAKIFGSPSNTGFGANSNTQNTAFGNLANQPTVGFGNLAQQASNASSQNAPFSGNSSFSSWR